MAGSGSESFTSRSVDHELISQYAEDSSFLNLHVEDSPLASADASMVRHARRARQRAREVVEALAAVDVEETESHSPAPRRVHQCGCRNRVVVDVASSQEGSIIDLTFIDTVQVTGSDEEE